MKVLKDEIHFVIVRDNDLFYSCHKSNFLDGYHAATRFHSMDGVLETIKTNKIKDYNIGKVTITTELTLVKE